MALEDKIEDLSKRVGKAINLLIPDNWYQRSDLFLPQQTSVQIYRTSVMINSKVYKNTSATSLSLNTGSNWDNSSYATAASRAGKDVYIYACAPSGTSMEPIFKLSCNSTTPTGYTATNSRKIGGFHCLCAAVGTISGHTLTGYAQGDVLPASIWDLRHHAVCGSEGMVFVNGVWVDIYLAGWDGTKLVSQYGATVADGSNGASAADADGGFSGESFAEYATYVGKSLIDRQTFMAAAEGSNQKTTVSGSADPVTTGGHVDTNGVRMISNYGCEDCCGAYWQYTCELADSGAIWYDALNSNAVLQTADVFYTSAKQINNRIGFREESVWEQSRSKLNTMPSAYGNASKGSGRGAAYSTLLRRRLVGADWASGIRCGTRSIKSDDLSSRRKGSSGARLMAKHYAG